MGILFGDIQKSAADRLFNNREPEITFGDQLFNQLAQHKHDPYSRRELGSISESCAEVSIRDLTHRLYKQGLEIDDLKIKVEKMSQIFDLIMPPKKDDI